MKPRAWAQPQRPPGTPHIAVAFWPDGYWPISAAEARDLARQIIRACDTLDALDGIVDPIPPCCVCGAPRPAP